MIELKANETKEITFSIDNKTIEFYTANNCGSGTRRF
jgi:beta-glucosidase